MKEIVLQDHQDKIDETIGKIGQTPYFRSVSDELLKRVFVTGSVYELEEGEVLIRQGDQSDRMFYILIEGAFKVFADGQFILKLDESGQMIGEMAVIRPGSHRSADVKASKPSQVVAIESSFLDKNDSPTQRLANSFLKMFTTILSEKLSITTDRAKLYEDTVLEKNEIDKYNKEITQLSENLKQDLQQKLGQIKLYSQVVEFNQDPIVIADEEGKLQSANSAFCNLFGYKRQDVRQLNLKELFKYFMQENSNWSVKFKKGWKEQKVAKRKDGSEFPALISISPVKTQGEKGVESLVYAAMVKDITIQKEYEDNLLKANMELKHTYEELENTLSELERTNQIKDQFFSNISTQLKTPVVSLTSYLDLMEKEGTSEVERTEIFEKIQTENRKLDQLVGNLLTMAELTPELSNLTFHVFEFDQLLDEFKQKAEMAQHCEFVIDEQVTRLVGDKSKLVQALVDVLVYAINCGKDERIHFQARPNKYQDQIEIRVTLGDPETFDQKPDSEFVEELANGVELQIQKGELNLPFAKKIVEFHQGEMLICDKNSEEQILIRLPIDPKGDISSHVKVLIVDENEWDRRLLRGVVEKQFQHNEIFEFDSQVLAVNALNAIKPSLVIVDPFFTTPQWDYDDFLLKLTDLCKQDSSVLAVSDRLNDLDVRNKIITLGITDFLFKPFTIDDALFKIKSIIETKQQFYRLSHNIKVAEKSAATDGMTGLFNRKYYDNFFKEQLIKSELQQGKCSLIMLDVDNFKHYNDTNGHQLGDEVLKTVSKTLKNGIRQSDMAARYGGEEFVVVLPGTPKNIAMKIAEKLRKSIEKTKFQNEESQPMGTLTASFGVSSFPDNGSDPETVLKAADSCLYLAKEEGRNKVVGAEGILQVEP